MKNLINHRKLEFNGKKKIIVNQINHEWRTSMTFIVRCGININWQFIKGSGNVVFNED